MSQISFNKTSLISSYLSWVIALSVFSYPISAVLIIQTGLPGNSTNFLIRVVFILLYSILLAIGVKTGGNRINKYVLPIFAFFAIYTIRLLVDINFRGIQIQSYSNFYVNSYFFGLTLLPCIAISSSKKYLNFRNLTTISYALLLIANLCLLYQLLSQGSNLNIVEILARRAQTNIEGDDRAFINPIVVGFFGGNLAILSIATLFISSRKGFLRKALFYLSIPLGIANLLFGASRGPMIAFILLLLLVFAYYIKHVKKDFSLFRKVLFFLTISLFAFYKFIVPFISNTNIFLISRFEAFFENRGKGKKEIRDFSFEGAWQDFLSSPVWGKQYVGSYDNFYPHNLPLEVLMATGLLGGLIYLLINLNLLRSLIALWYNPNLKSWLPLSLCGLSAILFTMTSGSIFFSPNYWIFLLLLTLLSSKSLKNDILLV